MYICMYEYHPFLPHNGITIANVLILLFSPVSDNFDLSWNCYYHYYYYCGMAPKRPDCGTTTAIQRLCSLSGFIPYATGRNATNITERCLGNRLTNGKPTRGNGSSNNSITRYTDSADITLHVSETEELLVVFSIRSDYARHKRQTWKPADRRS
jgi:hypothetical protein